MKASSFLLQALTLDFGDDVQIPVSFLSPHANLKNTHISIVAGANGTRKSRLLAVLIDKLCSIKANQDGEEYGRRSSYQSAFGLTCTGLSTRINGSEKLLQEGKGGLVGDAGLPTRVLALSNLVMDKFHFPRVRHSETQSGEAFYQYLGVRQATNLMTTGSVERSVSEAVLHMAPDSERLKAFQDWLSLVFGGGRELAFIFPRITQSEIKRFLNRADKEKYIRERITRRLGSAKRESINESWIVDAAEEISSLFNFLSQNFTEYSLPNNNGKSRPEAFLRLATLNSEDRGILSSLIKGFSTASRAGFSAWPALCIEGAPWIPFGELSSGEQNLLSVGAKLIAYSRPGCLVVIDEPEVSLNVAWQQQYTELVLRSLSHAPGSHVLIATHSPHLIASLPNGSASIILVEKNGLHSKFKTIDAEFEGWGSESILYQVLGIPSASSFHLNRDIASVLKHIQEGGRDKNFIQSILKKLQKIDFQETEPMGLVVAEIRKYLESLE